MTQAFLSNNVFTVNNNIDAMCFCASNLDNYRTNNPVLLYGTNNSIQIDTAKR